MTLKPGQFESVVIFVIIMFSYTVGGVGDDNIIMEVISSGKSMLILDNVSKNKI